MVMPMDQNSLMAILAEEYGIKSPRELAEAIRRMKPLDLAPFCATPEKTKEDTVAATTTATSSPAEIFPRFPMTTPVNSRSDRRMLDGTTNYPLPR